MRCAHRWVFASAMLLSTAQPCVAEARGVVVELIERGSVGERIGLRVGDHLVAWIRKSGTPAVITAKGQFASPFDARTFGTKSRHERAFLFALSAMRGASGW